MTEIKLGSEVQCIITGYKGIATARLEYINGCIQYCVKPKAGKDGKMPDPEYIDVQQLKVTGKGLSLTSKPTGGPQRDCPKH